MTALTKRRQELHLEWRATPESLDRMVLHEGATTVLYGDKILLAGWYFNGIDEPSWYGAVYEALADFEGPETDLGLAAISPGYFEDEGHAIEWAINTIK